MNGYTKPTKDEKEWDKAEKDAYCFKYRALNAIVYTVSTGDFRRISGLETTKLRSMEIS